MIRASSHAYFCLQWVCGAAFLMLLCVSAGQRVHAAEQLVSFDTPEQEALYKSLLVEYRCLKCQNQNLAGSNADLAADLKREIHLQVLDGKTKPDIDEYLVSRYGEFVLYRPRFNTVTALLWIGPFLLLAGGIVGIVVMARRNARRRAAEESQGGVAAGALHDGSISSAELERAKKLLE